MAQDASGYRPISDYALIGDGRTAALVSGDGCVDWLCLPDFDSASVFAGLLDRYSGGELFVRPAAAHLVSRRYRENTNVLETRFEAADGVVRVTDFMPLMINGMGGRLEPERQLLRIVEAEAGSPTVTFRFAPRPGYGERLPPLTRRGNLGWTFAHGADLFLLRTDLEAERDGQNVLTGRTRLRTGERRCLSLSFTSRDIGIIPRLGADVDEKLAATCRWWRDWLGQCDYDGPFREAVFRSLLALRLLTCTLSGAVIAAPTTSLPEAIGGTRNFDYRYCWPRDATFILRSFIDLGYGDEGTAFFRWLLHATGQTAPRLRTLYDIYGRPAPAETELQRFEGYRGSTPVRLGNAAREQLQLDVYGSVVSTAYEFVKRGGELDWSERRLLRGIGDVICQRWQEPDNGIWEFRFGRLHNTYSKVMCWSGLDSLLRLGRQGILDIDCRRLDRETRMIRQAVEREAWDEEMQCFTGAFGRPFLDAALLLMPQVGFIDAGDPRMCATYDAIVRRLGDKGLIRRYDSEDGFPGREGAFVICSFWAVEYLARRGDVAEARERMQHVLAHANDVGLFAEEIEPETGAFLGNFPQAFSHTGLISAALAIHEAETGTEKKGQA